MQSVCSLLPQEFADRIVDARARLSDDPIIGAIYDPPFAHFTHQLAVDYEWGGLASALAEFAKTHKPFEVRTTGILAFTGQGAGIGVGVRIDSRLMEYHSQLWETVSKFALERVDSFYEPANLVPHVTIKRCGTDADAFGKAMAKLANEEFYWNMTIDSVAVQHDPGKNSRTHYLRLRFPLLG
jgi:2'-5' RNA ligase